MWETSFDEPFVLGPKRAAVFRVAAACLSDTVGWEEWENECFDMGITVFDNLSQGQKQVAILTVSKALLDPKVEPPTVTAVIAATVHAIYCQLECLIEMEASDGSETELRQRLLEAIGETNYWADVNDGRDVGDEVTPLPLESDDMDRWNDLIESLRTEILEDYDFEMDRDIADMDPEYAGELKKNFGIKPDYFVAVVEDPAPEQLSQIRSEIRQLLY